MSNWALYMVTVGVWGSTWLAIEFQLGVVAPEVSIFYRYVGAALLLFGWCRWRGLRLRFDARAHLYFAGLGLLLFGLNYVLAYHAQRYVTSALIAIAFSTMVWMNIVNARLFFGARAGARVLVGALLGVAGIVAIFSSSIDELSFSDATVFGALLGAAGAYIASLGNMVSLRAQREKLPIVPSNAWGMAYGAVLTGLLAWFGGHEFTFDTSVSYTVSLVYLTVFGSIVAFGAYLTLLGRIGAARAGYAVVLFPVVAVVLSVLFEGLAVTVPMVAGIALVLLGNHFVMRERVRAADAAAPAAAEPFTRRAKATR